MAESRMHEENAQFDSDSNAFEPYIDKSKRKRRSTGGTFDSTGAGKGERLVTPSKEQFRTFSVDDKLSAIFDMMSKINSIDSRVTQVEQALSYVVKSNEDLCSRVNVLEYRSIDAEARARRNNLIFRGIREELLREDCNMIITQFIRQKLKIDTDIYIQRAHRLGKPSRHADKQNRPIIVCFRDYGDVELVLSSAYRLRDSPFGINRDYPKEIVEARSRLWADYKRAKTEYPAKGAVFIGFPARLVVNKTVVRDEFPDWRDILNTPRSTTYQQTNPKLPNIVYNPIKEPIAQKLDPNPKTTSVPTEVVAPVSIDVDLESDSAPTDGTVSSDSGSDPESEDQLDSYSQAMRRMETMKPKVKPNKPRKIPQLNNKPQTRMSASVSEKNTKTKQTPKATKPNEARTTPSAPTTATTQTPSNTNKTPSPPNPGPDKPKPKTQGKK